MPTPFDFEHADPWGSHFIDVASLNAAVSDAIADRVRKVHDEAAAGRVPPTSSLLVLGPAGTGKTHLFARLRRQLGPTASFVHVRPDIGVEATPRHVLAHVLASLQRETTKLAARQLDVVVGSLLATAQGSSGAGPLLHLDDYRRATPEAREALLETILERFERLAIDCSADYLELLLRTPTMSRVERQAALAWLSGREPSEHQLARLGRGMPLHDTEVIPALRTLAVMAALGAPLVLVFDQLENLIEPGSTDRIVAHGTLISELVDTVRGLTVVQMALDTEWLRAIRPALGASQRSRVEARMLALELPRPEQREELLRRWVDALPEEERGGAFPSPFAHDDVTRWCAAADMTPRALMLACRRRLAGEDAAAEPEELDARLERLWDEHLDRARAEHLAAMEEGSVPAERLASSLLAALSLEEGTVVKVRLLRSTTALDVQRGGRRGTVAILQQSHPRSVAAGLQHAQTAPAGGLLVVRDRSLPFRPSWRSCERHRAALLARPGARWLDLDHEVIARALATHDFLAAARSRDLDDAEGHPIEEEVARRWLVARGEHRDDSMVTAALQVVAPGSGDPAPAPVADVAVEGAAEIAGERRVEADAREPMATLLLEGVEPAPPSEPRSVEDVPSEPGRPTLLLPFAPSASRPRPAVDVGAVAALARLRVASLERLLREVRARAAEVSRAEVSAELAASAAVRWLGPSLVAYVERGAR